MENYKFNQNKKCEYFPCHKIENPKKNSVVCFVTVLYICLEESVAEILNIQKMV